MGLKERVQELCKRKGVTAQQAEIDLGFAKGSISKMNSNTPTAGKIQKMSEYFNVSSDYLISGLETEKAPADSGKRSVSDEDIKLALFGGDGEVTDEMWEEAIFAAQLIKERHKRKKE